VTVQVSMDHQLQRLHYYGNYLLVFFIYLGGKNS